MPAFASESFTSWFARRPKGRGGSRVLLWPDTFNNYFHPAVAKAAVGVLEDAGFKIVLPQRDPCCGRPLYDYGMLETARRWLRHVLSSLGEENEAGTPMVGLEPSCTAVFRDELIELSRTMRPRAVSRSRPLPWLNSWQVTPLTTRSRITPRGDRPRSLPSQLSRVGYRLLRHGRRVWICGRPL